MRFSQDLRYAFRLLRRDFLFSIVLIFTLAIGIGLSTSIFTIVDSVLLNKLPYRDADRVLSVAEQNKSGSGSTISFGTYADWKDRNKSLEHLAVYTDWQPTITDRSQFELASGIRVSHDFFSVLGIQPRLGRDFSAGEDHPGEDLVIISNPFWQKYFFSSPDVIGRTISLNGKPYTILGVLPNDFVATGFEADNGGVPDLWALLGYDRSLPDACRSCRHLQAIARLRPSVAPEQAQAELASIEADLARQFPTDYPSRPGAVVKLFQDRLVQGVRPVLSILLVSVLLLLVIVCTNISSLFFSRAIQRTREIGLRITLGARRSTIVRQLLTESMVLASLGGLLGLGLAIFATRFVYVLNSTLPRVSEISINGVVVAFSLAVSLLAGAVLGLTPSLLLSRGENTYTVLKEDARTSQGGSRRRLQGALVVAEIALALVLMGSAGLLLKSFRHLMQVDPGFNPNDLIAVDISLSEVKYNNPAKLQSFYHDVLDRVRSVPGVQSVAVVSTLPISGGYDRVGICLPDHGCEGQDSPRADRYIASPDYLATMKIPLLQGRGFSDQDTGSSVPVVLIGRTLAKQLGSDPIGKRIKIGDEGWATVIGVVGDVRQYGLDVAPKLQIYISNDQQPQSAATLIARTAQDPSSVMSPLRAAVGSVDKEQSVFNTHTMDEYLALSVSHQHFAMVLSTTFGAIGFFLAILGIYALTSYSVAQRTQEIGIRMALGAQPRNVFGLILKEVAVLSAIGIILGTIGAIAGNQVIKSLLFETSSADLLTYATVVVILIAAGLLAGYMPARRAMKVNPMNALRMDV